MSKIALNKSILSAEKKKQLSYQKYLPSLELKQKQLLAECKQHQQALKQHQKDVSELEKTAFERLPMLASKVIDLNGLVKITDLDIEYENQLGTLLPVLKQVRYERAEYSFLSRPHWFDDTADYLEKVVKLKLEERILEERLARLNKAVQTITQRVNLFSKVLLPQSKANIKTISLFLADQDRSAVVRSKIAKQKHQSKAIPVAGKAFNTRQGEEV